MKLYIFNENVISIVYLSFVSEPISQLFTISFQPLRLADTSPIFYVAKHPVILRDTAGRREVNTFLVFVFLPYTTNRRSLYRFATPR